jgi:hypothetical protein
MFIRLAVTSFAVLLLAACDEPNVCKDLSKTDCAANAECEWNTERGRCRKNPPEDKNPKTTSTQAQ